MFKYYVKRLFTMDYKKMLVMVNKIHKRSNKSRIYLFFDMIICSIKYQAGYMDYWLFYFENLKGHQRKTYITRGVNNRYIKKMNDRSYYKFFDDKYLFNKKFKKYIKRDYMLLDNNFDKFNEFARNHNLIVVKPINMQCGKNIEKIEINKTTNIKELYTKLVENKQLLIEECVLQNKTVNKLFPNSVNTLRIVTARINNETTVLFRAIRVGNGNNVVDNFNHGGMYTIINEDGILIKPALDKNDKVYEFHPVTKTKIEGFKIPYFKEAIKMVIEASKVIPEVGLVGWDIAITDNGPLMIEGNQLPGYDIYQSKIHLNEDRIGLKPTFDKVIYR